MLNKSLPYITKKQTGREKGKITIKIKQKLIFGATDSACIKKKKKIRKASLIGPWGQEKHTRPSFH